MENIVSAASSLVPAAMMAPSLDSNAAMNNSFRHLLTQRKLPENGWSDVQIEAFLTYLSLMDSNNFGGRCGVGEREGRVFSSLVRRRHYHLSHGVGRSGDLAEPQPKAAGSSVMARLVDQLALHALRLAGLRSIQCCVLVPMATGMTTTLCLLTLRQQRPLSARYVIWPRIDQKSCFKAIITAGFEPVVVENIVEGDELRSDVSSIEAAIEQRGADNVLCVLSTTSCFAPRAMDRVQEIAELCARLNVAHLINNAYGVQSSQCCHHIEHAHRRGRVDLLVQSTDKNFQVPVGGALVASYQPELCHAVTANYPGRASASPCVDLLITLLAMGVSGWCQLLTARRKLMQQMREQLQQLVHELQPPSQQSLQHPHAGDRPATKLRLLDTPHNQISLALSLPDDGDVGLLGSMLFRRGVSGARALSPRASRTVATHCFNGWGCHHAQYPCCYLTAAVGIGMSESELSTFVTRLRRTLCKWCCSSTSPPRHLNNTTDTTDPPHNDEDSVTTCD